MVTHSRQEDGISNSKAAKQIRMSPPPVGLERDPTILHLYWVSVGFVLATLPHNSSSIAMLTFPTSGTSLLGKDSKINENAWQSAR